MVSHHGIYNSNASNTYQTWSKGEGNSKPPQLSCLENPTNSMKRQKYMTLKDELPKSVDKGKCLTYKNVRTDGNLLHGDYFLSHSYWLSVLVWECRHR